MGVWKIIIPEESTNMVLNPVGMGTGNVTAVNTGVPTMETTYSYFGYKCHKLVTDADNEGAYWTLSALTNAIHYMTLRIYNTSDITPMFDCSLDNATFNAPTLLSTEGNWWVYGYQFPAVQANASTKLYIQQNGAGGNTLYIGHLQVEAKSYPTTPITGDLIGFTSTGYLWNGAPHLSSSIRSAQERKGGVVKDLEDDYNFRVLYGVGSGMPPLTHHTQGQALLPGALFQGSKVEPRSLDLYSGTKATTVAAVATARKNFINAVKPDAVTPEQPVVIRYSAVNVNKPVEFYGIYDTGLGFEQNSGIVDKPDARFICYDPFCYELHSQSASLTTSLSVADADYVARKINGTWSNISGAFDDYVEVMVKGNDGCIYIGGGFSNVGDANGDGIVKWNPYTNTLSSLGTGMTMAAGQHVMALAVAPNGDIYAGGGFTSAGGVANTSKLAYWDISAGAWASVSASQPNDQVNSLKFDQSGNLFVGGLFAQIGAIANTAYIAKWDGTTWTALGTGMSAGVYDSAISPDNYLYVTGPFVTGNGVTLNGIGKWNGTTFVALGSGLAGGTATGYSLVFDKAGNLYITGSFTSANSVSCNYITKWNGKAYEPLGSGLGDTGYVLAISDDDNLYAGGSFTSAGGITLSDLFAIWNGTTWVHPDINLPLANTVISFYPIHNDLYLGYAASGTATSSYLNTITNSGSTIAYPIIRIKRAEDGTTAVIEWLKNETTGETIWLNYSLQKGETLTLDFTPGKHSVKSSFFGDVWRAVLRGSNFGSFHLQPGTNKISVFVNPTGSPTITAWLEAPIAHWSADMVAA